MPRTEASKTRARAGVTNAHIRKDVPTAKQEAPATGAHRLLNDPELITAFERMKAELVGRIESGMPGTAEQVELEREYCRQLRSISGLKKALAVTLQLQSLKDHNFRPAPPAKKENE